MFEIDRTQLPGTESTSFRLCFNFWRRRKFLPVVAPQADVAQYTPGEGRKKNEEKPTFADGAQTTGNHIPDS